jgi:SAM-dependent methyltransferase
MRNLIEYTENYFNQPFENIQVSFRKKKVLELVSKQKHRIILEVGCGLDPLFNHYDDFEQLVILEPSTVFFDNAKKTIIEKADLNTRVTIIQGYLETSVNDLRKFEFDYIIISCLLHEIEDLSLFLDKLRCILKPDTIVHVDVPNAYSFHRLLALEMGLINSVFEMSASNLQFQQQRVFDKVSLKVIIVQHGFKVIDSGSYFIKPFTHKQMSGLLGVKIIDSEVLDGLFKMIKYMPDLGSEIYVDFKIDD